MDAHEYEDVRQALDRARAALRLLGPGRRPLEIERVSRLVAEELATVRGKLVDMHRRDALRSIGVLGLPALMPSAAVRFALMTSVRDTDATLDLHFLQSQVAALWNARQACRYEELAALTPCVLANLNADSRPESQALSSLAYQCLANCMSELGIPIWHG